jgi:tetratricopeptide (TPR) repeat protein
LSRSSTFELLTRFDALILQEKKYGVALDDFRKIYEAQKRNPKRNNNNYMLGITAHNMGVICVLAGREQLALPLFEEAVAAKRKAFGQEHPEVAVSLFGRKSSCVLNSSLTCSLPSKKISLDELGIQLFARERFDEALATFNEVKRIRSKSFGSTHPQLAMVLNNIACCNFEMGNPVAGLLSMKDARELQVQKNNSNSSAKADLDLLHMAILLSNCGYLNLNMKQYEDARSCFEEALMVSFALLRHVIIFRVPIFEYAHVFNSLLIRNHRFNNPFWAMPITTERSEILGAIWSSPTPSTLDALRSTRFVSSK